MQSDTSYHLSIESALNRFKMALNGLIWDLLDPTNFPYKKYIHM